jgi:hypothetical protein
MVVGFTTICAIIVYYHCQFEPRSWWGVLHSTLCDKVGQWFVTGFLRVLCFLRLKVVFKHHKPTIYLERSEWIWEVFDSVNDFLFLLERSLTLLDTCFFCTKNTVWIKERVSQTEKIICLDGVTYIVSAVWMCNINSI